ncbi:MAG: hypothetical protein RLZZ435_2517 [Cyanobacteriota bacterium]|jgi:glycosyltransferase involved in cell wall biosynthesis
MKKEPAPTSPLMESLQQVIPVLPMPKKSSSRKKSRQSIALISVHGDPAIEVGGEEAGGQNVYVRQVGEALAALGWKVDMFTRKSSADAPTIVQHSEYCRTIRLTAGPEAFVPRDELFQHLPEFVTGVEKYLQREHYPLIHTNYWLSGWVGLQLRQNFHFQWLHTYHSLGVIKYQTTQEIPPIGKTRLASERQVLEQADRIVATSPQEQTHMETLMSHRGAIEVIPCGTDIESFQSLPTAEARQVLGWDPADKIALYVGRFDRRKGIETLVRAASLLTDPQFRLVIVGGCDPKKSDGAEYQRIAGLVESLGLQDRVTFAGRVGHDRLPLYYAAANVCVVPSHYEPFGLVAIEAMACGTPVIASDVGGLKFTVKSGKTGLLVPPQEETKLAQALQRILGQPAWAAQLGQAATQRVQQKFSWTGVAQQLSHLYRYLMAVSLMTELPKRSGESARKALESAREATNSSLSRSQVKLA